MQEFIKAQEKISICQRSFAELTDSSKKEHGASTIEDIKQIASKLPILQSLNFSSAWTRATVYRFSLWLSQTLNRLDAEEPDCLYLLPEIIVEIPFEVFRAFKRGNYSIYDTESERLDLNRFFPKDS